MKKYNFQLTLFDSAFILASFMLLGAGFAIMCLNGFDAWFAYLLALPAIGAAAKVRTAFHHAAKVDPSGSTQGASGSSLSAVSPK